MDKKQKLILALREYGVRLSDIKQVLSYIKFLDFEYKEFVNSLPPDKALSIEEVREIFSKVDVEKVREVLNEDS